MAYIEVDKNLPGIRSLVVFRPESGRHLYELAQVLLRGESPIPMADRELIAAHVSALNKCMFCMSSHAAAARCLYGDDRSKVDNVLHHQDDDRLSPKIKALLAIAAKVQQSGRAVEQADIDKARLAGADDREIHDTVLIAATFCMFNRYVDGLASFTPTDPNVYAEMGERMATHGYTFPKTMK